MRNEKGGQFMSSYLNSAPLSPRVDQGVLKWFEGDTFGIDMEINLVREGIDEDGNGKDDPVIFDDNDQLIVTFFNSRREVIHSFIATHINEDPTSEMYHTISLTFTKAISSKFRKGKYTYCIKYLSKDSPTAVDITTICVNNKVEVEACH